MFKAKGMVKFLELFLRSQNDPILLHTYLKSRFNLKGTVPRCFWDALQGLLWGFRLKGSEIYNKIFQILDNGEKALLLNEKHVKLIYDRHN